MMKVKKYGFLFVQLLCVCAMACGTEDELIETREQDERVHLAVGERIESYLERVLVKESRQEVSEEKEEAEEARVKDVLLTSKSLRQEINFGNSEDPRLLASSKLPKFTGYYTTHQGVYQRPYLVAYDGGSVELYDGSIWTVCSYDRYKTLNWLTSDSIIVTPNSNFFSIYDYCLVNLNTNVTVQVNLFAGPLYNGIYTYYITGIDYVNDLVYLNDGSSWGISVFDSSTSAKWFLNDTVILGVNNDPLSIRPNILINVNMLNYVRATCLN
ncbi:MULTISPECIES: hypothetical protein [Parachlamydia]|jgi:hypothetical protein|nr:hypothetical protein [Parachlamydia acanthamoebae]EFB42636.1 hypothetical protein pah_c004o163 [Parachlamydia acanthamoebae str. Hall's coccus]